MPALAVCMMQDPSIQIELFNLCIKMEQPATKAPDGLERDVIVKLVIESNDYAFYRFK